MNEEEIKKGKRKKNKGSKKKLKIIISIILAIIFIISVTYIIIHFVGLSRNKKTYEQIQPDNSRAPEEKLSENLNISDDFIEKVKELKEINSDVIGWIRIEDTKVNYPLLKSYNNDFYLRRDYKKDYSWYGSIYVNSNSNIEDNNSNVIIYGHNTEDGQMFSQLLNYQDKNFYDSHPVIKIANTEKETEYEIIYVFKSRIFYQDETNVFRYYRYYNWAGEWQYNEYINNCAMLRFYDTGKQAHYGEQLITLVTCEYSQENGRLVIVAKKIEK